MTVESPLGPLTLTSAGGALAALDWGRVGADDPDALLAEAARQLDLYFAGRITDFDLPMAPAGSPFRQKVWAAMRTIPYARVATYGDLARGIGTAPRAVGGACGANPLPILIPCHRVVGGSGAPGGYSGMGGLGTKSWLLEHERRFALAPAEAAV
nr:methylated-DNA--[protein]-cysteine S-methyltransferase [Azospirillum sp. SYSU D00513]